MFQQVETITIETRLEVKCPDMFLVLTQAIFGTAFISTLYSTHHLSPTDLVQFKGFRFKWNKSLHLNCSLLSLSQFASPQQLEFAISNSILTPGAAQKGIEPRIVLTNPMRMISAPLINRYSQGFFKAGDKFGILIPCLDRSLRYLRRQQRCVLDSHFYAPLKTIEEEIETWENLELYWGVYLWTETSPEFECTIEVELDVVRQREN